MSDHRKLSLTPEELRIIGALLLYENKDIEHELKILKSRSSTYNVNEDIKHLETRLSLINGLADKIIEALNYM